MAILWSELCSIKHKIRLTFEAKAEVIIDKAAANKPAYWKVFCHFGQVVKSLHCS